MIRIAIVEDDADSARQLKGYLQRYGQENGEVFDLTEFSDGEEIVSAYRPVYDIILLDVQMQHLDGFATAKRVRQLDSDVIIIFITNMAQYAIRGYEVDALSYLLKPVPYFAFSQELKRSLERLYKREKSYLMLPVEQGFIRLDVKNILYIESEKHRVTIYTESGESYSMVATMKEMEAKLAQCDFFRCNSGYLVNLDKVTGVANSCALVGGHSLQISRPKKKAFLAALTDYMGVAR